MAILEGNRLSRAIPSGRCAAAFVLTSIGIGATAAEGSHGVHEHGAAEIELALEGSDVLVHIASPLYNLVGFEHAPRDERDREAVAAARILLEDPGNLLLVQADAMCAVVELDIDWDMSSGEEKEHDHDEAEKHDAHGDRHEDEHAAHESHDADDEHDADEGHADVTVAIRYRCDHPNRLNDLNVTAFESFARLLEVEFRAVGPGGTVAETLEPGSSRVDLRDLLGR